MMEKQDTNAWKGTRMRKVFCLLLALVLLTPALALGETAQRVFYEEETEPFSPDAELLTLRVCPLLGADCMLLTLGEHSMLIDAGKSGHADDIQAMLQEAGLTGVEYMFNTHPHSDHMGSVKPLLERGFTMGTFFTFFPHDYYEDPQSVKQTLVIKAVQEAGVPIVDLKTEDTISFGSAEMTVYRVPDQRITAQMHCNDLSGMLLVRYGECSLLLTGDVERRAQAVLVELYDLKADILKVPHHGVDATTPEFLSGVDPEFAFFTHGSINTPDAQEQLLKYGCNRMYFATWGPITLQTDGEKWIVRQEILPDMKDYAAKYWKNYLKK